MLMYTGAHDWMYRVQTTLQSDNFIGLESFDTHVGETMKKKNKDLPLCSPL